MIMILTILRPLCAISFTWPRLPESALYTHHDTEWERENEGWKTYAQVRWRKGEKEKARVCMCTSVLATKRKIPTHWTSNRARKTSSNLLYWNKTISAVMTQNLSTIIHCSRQYIYCCANTRKTPTRIYTIFFLINIVIIWTQFCANSKKKIESKHLGKLTKWNCFTSM